MRMREDGMGKKRGKKHERRFKSSTTSKRRTHVSSPISSGTPSSAHSDRSSVSKFLSDARTSRGPSSPAKGLSARDRCLSEPATSTSCGGSRRNALFSSQSHSRPGPPPLSSSTFSPPPRSSGRSRRELPPRESRLRAGRSSGMTPGGGRQEAAAQKAAAEDEQGVATPARSRAVISPPSVSTPFQSPKSSASGEVSSPSSIFQPQSSPSETREGAASASRASASEGPARALLLPRAAASLLSLLAPSPGWASFFHFSSSCLFEGRASSPSSSPSSARGRSCCGCFGKFPGRGRGESVSRGWRECRG